MENCHRIDQMIHHPEFLSYLKENENAEKERIFCKHQIEHFLDVARIAYIKILEEKVDLSKELIYAAALLHDIGKHKQYKEGIPHEIASAELAEKILQDCGYCQEERKRIQTAILNHRNYEASLSDDFSRILYESDKQSRICMFCKAKKECNWSEEKKMKRLSY